MLTNSFKATVGGLVVLAIVGGLGVIQYNQEQQIKDLQPKVVVTPIATVVPVIVTATPSATIVPVSKVVPVRVVTVIPVVTHTVVK